ncbi:hypothetical protein N7451_006123 [Penicillium sp. IBT 35674x]|nr:hypothetical protein N7451_006123 [Penicillium sp. IBT 35674x]
MLRTAQVDDPNISFFGPCSDCMPASTVSTMDPTAILFCHEPFSIFDVDDGFQSCTFESSIHAILCPIQSKMSFVVRLVGLYNRSTIWRWQFHPQDPEIQAVQSYFGILTMTPNVWNDARAPDCKISRSKLTARDLESRGYAIRYTGKSLDSKYAEPLSQVDLPTEGEFYHHIDIEAPFATGKFKFEAYIGENLVILEDIVRGDHPHISEISQALYQIRFSMDSLRYIMVSDIINTDTVGFAEPNLYGENVNDDPYFYNEYPGVRTWEYDTDEYQALLGTQIGKISASFILGAFTRGTRQISRVVTWINDSLLYMQFDIEDVR